MKLHNYCIRYMYRENDDLQTKIVVLENQSTPLTVVRRYAKATAEKNGWRLLDVTRLTKVEA